MVAGRRDERIYLSVAIRWLTTAQASSGRAFLITSTQSCSLARCVHLRLETTTDDIDSPGRADQSINQGIPENRRFDRLQSLVGFGRGQDGFPQILIDLSRVGGSADKGVVEHVVYTRGAIEVALCRTMNRVPLNSLAMMGLASISVMKAAKSPML